MSDNTFSEEQKAAIAVWVDEGASLSEIQKRINSTFGQSITYMELRFLVDDLRLTLKDKPTPKNEKNNAPAANDDVLSVGDTADYAGGSYQSAAGAPADGGDDFSDDETLGTDDGLGSTDAAADAATDADGLPAGAGKVTVEIDPVQPPGLAATGTAKFPDGTFVKWILSGDGRLGFMPPHERYRPTAAAARQFQTELQNELVRAGLLG